MGNWLVLKVSVESSSICASARTKVTDKRAGRRRPKHLVAELLSRWNGTRQHSSSSSQVLRAFAKNGHRPSLGVDISRGRLGGEQPHSPPLERLVGQAPHPTMGCGHMTGSPRWRPATQPTAGVPSRPGTPPKHAPIQIK